MADAAPTRRRRPRLLLPAAVVLGALAAAATPAALRAQVPDPPAALLHVAQDRDGRDDYRTFRNTQAVLVTSRTVVKAALKKPGVADLALVKRQKDPVAWLQGSLVADFPRDAEVLRISLRSHGDPGEAAALVNAVTDSYLEEFVQKGQDVELARRQQLRDLADRYEHQLQMKRRTAEELARAVGSGNESLVLQRHSAREALAATEKELLQVRSERRRLEVELELQEEKKPGNVPPPESLLDEQVDRDPSVKQQRDRIARLESVLEDITKTVASPNEPTLEKTRQQLRSAREALEARRKELRAVAARQVQEKKQAADRTTAAQLREKIAYLSRLEKKLAEEVKRLRDQAGQLGTGAVDLESIRDEIAQAEAVLKKVSTEATRLEVRHATPPRVTLLEKAEAPRAK
jgi:hypothetical protein